MQFPESWLRAFCNPPLSSADLTHTLTMAGFEVEAAAPAAPPFTGVVVAEILSAEQHPGADRLRVCRVDAGQGGEPLQIVCGAHNARVGIKVPLATVGARLPAAEAGGEPLAIKVGKLRGVESFGMLCSARELGLSTEHAGLLELAADAPVGQNIREHLALDDSVFTIKLTPNLGHALSVYGLARELAAVTGAPLAPPPTAHITPSIADRVPVILQAPDLCGRFAGRVVRGVDAKAKTPEWMVQRLARCGQRSISALVDISNYVMFELGRPSHMFDLGKTTPPITVRWAREGETLALLNGQTAKLDPSIGVVADANGPEALAGIMGGDPSAVGDSTRDVFIEAAFWWPEAVAGRSRRLGFATDAGHRFERGVDAESIPAHLDRITALVLEICGGEAGPITDEVSRLPERLSVRLRAARAAKVIGMPITLDDCARVFERLSGFAFTRDDAAGTLSVTPPPWRFDITLEEDLIEEVARLIGYDKLPPTPPQGTLLARPTQERRRAVAAWRHAVAARGYQETINYSFIDQRWESELHGVAEPIRVLNPIAEHLAVMRSSLIAGLVGVARYNLARKARTVRVFEVGRVFRKDAGVADGPLSVRGIHQPMRVAGLALGPTAPLQWGQKERAVDFFDVKGDVEALLAPRTARFEPADHPALHPGRSAVVLVDGVAVGVVGELHPQWLSVYELTQAPVVFELDLAALSERALPQAEVPSKTLAVTRDIALVVSRSASHAALMEALRADPSGLLRDAVLFDVFRPQVGAGSATAAGEVSVDEHSLALRLTLQSPGETLTDAQIEAVVQAAIARAGQATGARLRGVHA